MEHSTVEAQGTFDRLFAEGYRFILLPAPRASTSGQRTGQHHFSLLLPFRQRYNVVVSADCPKNWWIRQLVCTAYSAVPSRRCTPPEEDMTAEQLRW
jgi:hypothetical protein